MPHYVTKPTQSSRKYYVFSTISMGPITKKMYRSEMLEWLKTAKGYEGFLDPRPWIEQNPEWYEGDSQWMTAIKRETEENTYWNGSFWYVTEEDGYFV